MSSNSSILNSSQTKFGSSLSSASFLGLVPINKGLIDPDNVQLINKLKKKSNNYSLAGQFFTLGLLEYVCNILNPNDQVSASNKFKEICQKLVKFDIIGVDLTSDLFKQIRWQYQKLLYHIFNQQNTIRYPQITYSKPIKISPTDLVSPDVLTQKTRGELIFSRYASDFIELEKIASGGFGSVFKAKNVLDQTEYAIKKIYLKSCQQEFLKKVNLEVRVFASLNHENIVSYHCSWVEFDLVLSERSSKAKLQNKTIVQCDLATSSKNNYSQENVEKLDYIINQDEDSDIVFTESLDAKPKHNVVINEMHDRSSSNSQSNCLSSIHNGNGKFYRLSNTKSNYSGFTSFESSLNSSKNVSSEMFKKSQQNISDSASYENVTVLYIQMKLCDCTLKTWLESRNNEIYELHQTMNEVVNLDIFRQIVSGVDYIHSRNIIHRDLKPGNIFLLQHTMQVKIGDFGLSCLDTIEKKKSVEPDKLSVLDSSNSKTKGIGTPVYASPEQIDGRENYDTQSDMYSLGIIFFELYHPFKTNMEKFIEIENLKKGILTADMNKWQAQSQMIKSLLSKIPSERPSAFQILNSELFMTKDQIIDNLYKLLKQKDDQISLLKMEIKSKDDAIKKKDDILEKIFTANLG